MNIKDLLLQILYAHLCASMEGETHYVVPTTDGPKVQRCIDRATFAFIRVEPSGRISCVQKMGPKCVDFRLRHTALITDFYAQECLTTH